MLQRSKNPGNGPLSVEYSRDDRTQVVPCTSLRVQPAKETVKAEIATVRFAEKDNTGTGVLTLSMNMAFCLRQRR
jgi:hypothetical protein